MNRQEYEEDLKRRQAEHIKRISTPMEFEYWQPCLHDLCPECLGTGLSLNGGTCVHWISCPCPKCAVSYL